VCVGVGVGVCVWVCVWVWVWVGVGVGVCLKRMFLVFFLFSYASLPRMKLEICSQE
jgi:hypothetical protein